jgi:hypothetical protein
LILFIECGITYIPPTARIIGGSDTIAHSWPFAVLIRQRYTRIVTVNDNPSLVKHYKFTKLNSCVFFILFRFQYHGYVEVH